MKEGLNEKIREAYRKALKTKTQPICPYCNDPLKVRVTECVEIIWEWDDETKIYVKVSYGDCEQYFMAPICDECCYEDYDFLATSAENKEAKRLGLLPNYYD